jgi:hypothetical protein
VKELSLIVHPTPRRGAWERRHPAGHGAKRRLFAFN